MGIYFRTMIRNIVSKCRWPDVQVLNILKFVCKTHGFETLFLDIFQYSMERFQRVRPSNRSPECDSTVVPDCQSMLLHSSSQRSKVKNCTSLYPITGVQYEQVLTQNFIYHIYKFKRFNQRMSTEFLTSEHVKSSEQQSNNWSVHQFNN